MHSVWRVKDGVLTGELPPDPDKRFGMLWTERPFGDYEFRAVVWAGPYSDLGFCVRHQPDRPEGEPELMFKTTVTTWDTPPLRRVRAGPHRGPGLGGVREGSGGPAGPGAGRAGRQRRAARVGRADRPGRGPPADHRGERRAGRDRRTPHGRPDWAACGCRCGRTNGVPGPTGDGPARVEVRSLRVRPLPAADDAPPSDSADSADAGWTDLFDGRTSAGWGGDDAGLWRVEGGTLIGELPAGAAEDWTNVWTDREFADHEVRAVVRSGGEGRRRRAPVPVRPPGPRGEGGPARGGQRRGAGRNPALGRGRRVLPDGPRPVDLGRDRRRPNRQRRAARVGRGDRGGRSAAG